ncbi:MAG: two-component sensor histidine kinase, partial [Anaerolineae bacterium]|nr:two-component sensor histidine kinase [Anaerolineae bacterium]
PYVTRRFYRVPGTTAPGSGLGLALVAAILRRHESRLELESRTVGETGTCARFVLSMPDDKSSGTRRARSGDVF